MGFWDFIKRPKVGIKHAGGKSPTVSPKNVGSGKKPRDVKPRSISNFFKGLFRKKPKGEEIAKEIQEPKQVTPKKSGISEFFKGLFKQKPKNLPIAEEPTEILSEDYASPDEVIELDIFDLVRNTIQGLPGDKVISGRAQGYDIRGYFLELLEENINANEYDGTLEEYKEYLQQNFSVIGEAVARVQRTSKQSELSAALDDLQIILNMGEINTLDSMNLSDLLDSFT